MRRVRPGIALASSLLLAALVAGCGQKGALYLPEPSTQPAAPEQPPPAKP
jgi:predicted small lipoprotein YifL